MKYNGLRYLTKQLRAEPLFQRDVRQQNSTAPISKIAMDDFAVELTGLAGVQLTG